MYGGYTGVPSYEDLKRKREIVDLLTQRAMGNGDTPDNLAEGLTSFGSQIGNAILARRIDKKLQPQEDVARQAAMEQLMQIRGGLGPEGISMEQLEGLGGVTENPYADPAVEAIARTLMRRQVTGINGETATIPEDAPMMQFAEGGQMHTSSLGPAPTPRPQGWEPWIPEEPGPAQPVQYAGGMGSGIPAGPMSGAGGGLDTRAPAGIEVAGDLKLTEGQSKDLGFWNRMDGVAADVDRFSAELAEPGQRARGSVPLIGNALVSEEYQRGRRAAEEWVAGILRKDTGAAVTKEEMDRYDKVYIPQAFDDPATLEDKRAARQRAMDGLKKGLGIAEILADELAAARSQEKPPEPNDADAELFKKYGLE